jgi:predicted SAM-dependent methyltransferase
MSLFIKRRCKELLNKFRSENKLLKFHIGCGGNYKEGWINIDNNPHAKKDLRLDLRKGIPFPDNSVDYIYNEHFIEHLSYEDGFAFFKEAYKVLRPQGVIRTAFPDMDTLIDSYKKDYWRQMEWVRLINAHWYPSGCFMLNQCIREKGAHLYMYNISELKRRLKEAGFKENNLHECKVNQSNHSELKDIEKRADSSIVEAIK